jgi:exodeoxyribonuclease VII large subunit
MELDASGQPVNETGNLPERTVSELSAAIRLAIEDGFGFVRVRGEIGRVSRPGSGHVYLDLKDDHAVISGVIWKNTANRLQTNPEQGLEVVVTGKVTTFPGQSKYQIVIETLEPAGAGALMALLEGRRRKLEAEGLFAPERKRALPLLPRVIGVVTSPTGSVIRDILHRIADRFPLHVVVWPVRVQGEGCGGEVAAAIRGFNGPVSNLPFPRPDLLIVARGGGSLEDLWGFNDEEVVRAAAQSEIPLISAIGHETDWTLIDLAADYRAPTPTGAAEIAVPVKAALLAEIASLGARLASSLTRHLDRARAELRAAVRGLGAPDKILAAPRQSLDAVSARLASALALAGHRKRAEFLGAAARLSPGMLQRRLRIERDGLSAISARSDRAYLVLIGRHRARLESVLGQLTAARIERFVSQSRERLNRVWRLLSGLSHQRVLERGFALIESAGGRTVISAGGLSAGDAFDVIFRDGKVPAVAGSRTSGGYEEKPRKRQRSAGRGQGNLFG